MAGIAMLMRGCCCTTSFVSTRTNLPPFPPPSLKVSELSVIIDSAFLYDAPGYMAPFLDYLQEDPSAAYSSHCSEVRNGHIARLVLPSSLVGFLGRSVCPHMYKGVLLRASEVQMRVHARRSG